MKRSGLLAALSAVLAFGQWRDAKPHEVAPTFKSEVSLVRVDAEVAERGRAVTGLSKDDFLVRDNGSVVKLSGFGREEVPLDVILVFDVSGSMRPAVEEVASAAGEAMRELREGDRVAVIVFSSGNQLLLRFTSDLRRVEQCIERDVLGQPFRGSTHIQRAAERAAGTFLEEKRTERRRAILFLTDNEGQRTTQDGPIVEKLWEADAVLSGLIIGGGVAGRVIGGVLNPTGILIDQAMRAGIGGMADKTGGELVKAANVARDFPGLMARLRNRYSLYYPMPAGKAGEQRKVLVELAGKSKASHPEARVFARKGYVLPADVDAP
jgi:VWFA-related protein